MNSLMVIDDSAINLTMIEVILGDLYLVSLAESASEAIAKLEAGEKPDIILLDVEMPEMSGFELIKVLKDDKRWNNIPVLFISGHVDSEFERTGLELGALDYITKPFDPYVVRFKVRNQLELCAYREKLEKLVDERTQEIFAAEEAIIISLAYLSEMRDENTGAHLMRLKGHVRRICNQLMIENPGLLTKKQADLITLLSPVHDIGKVAVPDYILLKPAALTAEEFEEMKKHTVYGADVLRYASGFLHDDYDTLRVGTEICEGHHEKYSGGGYPYGLKGDDIPLSARIIAICDVYDALVDVRPYKKAFTHEQAVRIICEGDGRTMPEHFDPRVLSAFKNSIAKGIFHPES